jgi:large subunit ribosomal protein L30
MSAKQKRKSKPKTSKKETPKAVRKRRPAEEKTKPIVSTPEKVVEKKPAEAAGEKPLFLAVRLLGPFAVPKDIEHALGSLRLKRRFTAVLMEKNPTSLGMLRRVKDYVTWGEVDSRSIAALFKERGFIGGNHLSDKLVKERLGIESVEQLARAITHGQLSLKTVRNQGVEPIFNLHPPSGGFQWNIKRPVGSRGELGYRGDQIGHLISRMM